jgi:hypothetical protein
LRREEATKPRATTSATQSIPTAAWEST